MQESIHHMQCAANSIRRSWRKWIAGILGHGVCNPLNKISVCVCAWLLPAVSPIISASRMFSRQSSSHLFPLICAVDSNSYCKFSLACFWPPIKLCVQVVNNRTTRASAFPNIRPTWLWFITCLLSALFDQQRVQQRLLALLFSKESVAVRSMMSEDGYFMR